MKYFKLYENYDKEITWLESAKMAGYEIDRQLGEGSMSIVFSLKDSDSVLKITNSRITANTAKFLQNNIDHPNVTKILDVKHIKASEYSIVDDRTNWYPIDDLYLILIGDLDQEGDYNEDIVNKTLEYLEEKGVHNDDFHKDNIMYNKMGEPVIIDIMDGSLEPQKIEKIIL